MADPESAPVTLAEFKQRFRWSSVIGLVWVVVYLIALRRLRVAGISQAVRIAWCAAPLPPMAYAFWQMIRDLRRQSEMERVVTGESMGYAFYLTVAFYAVMGLVNTAFTIDAETWATIWVIPIILFAGCWMWVYRRYNPR